MKRLVSTAALGAALFSCHASAAPGFHDAGPNLTYGGASSPWTTLSATRNPAASEYAIAPDSTVRMGILSSIGASMEVGPVDNFVDDIDRLMDELDRDDITLSEGNALVSEFNSILGTMGEDGYLKLQAGVQAPLFPIIIRSGIGVFTVDANVGLQAGIRFLDSPLTYNGATEELETASALYIKSAALSEVSLGFSRPLWKQDTTQLTLGGRLRYLQGSLSKQVVALESVEDDEDVGDVVSDSYDTNERTTSNVTLDVGAIFSGSNYRVGLTVANLTEPEFEYGPIGVNCGDLTGSAQYNCFTAAYFSDRINPNETWTLERLATVEAALLFANGSGSLSAAVDLNEVNDPVGQLNQWFSVALGYTPQTAWIPGARVGYHKNLAGSELSNVSAGLTFFKRLHLDVAYGLESIEVDDSSVPRTLAVNLGIEMAY